MDSTPTGSRSWSVTKDGKPHGLMVDDNGLTLLNRETEQESTYRWGDLEDVTCPTPFDVTFTVVGEHVALKLHAGAIQRELRAAMQEHGVAVHIPPPPPLPTGGFSAPSGRPGQRAGDDYLLFFFIAGLGVGLVGILLLATQWQTSSCPEYDDCSGSDLGALVGFALVAVANILTLISVIGWGVKFGLRAAVADGTLRRS